MFKFTFLEVEVMKKILIGIFVLSLTSCATVNERSPYMMKVTDWSGNARPYYMAGEALNLHVWWDANYDTGKAVDCSFSNSFSGEVLWRGVLIIPESKPGQIVSNTVWNPAFPSSGLKFDAGSYISVCNFDNSQKASIAFTVVDVPSSSKT